MEEVVSILYRVIDNFLEVIKFYLVNRYIFSWKTKEWNWKKTIVVGAAVIGISLFFNYWSEQINPLFLYILFLFVVTFVTFEEAVCKQICVVLLEMYAICIMDIMIQQMYIVLLELVKKDLQVPMYVMASVTTCLFLLFIVYAMRDKMRGYVRKIPIRYYIIFICLDTGNCIMLGVFKSIIEKQNIALRIAFTFIVLGVFLELALLLILAATREVYKEKDLLNQKYLKSQESHYKYLEQRETATRKFRHDMRNHIFLLQHLLEQGKQEEAKQYVDEMEERFTAMGTPISVQHGIVDAILNKYAAECKEKSIQLSVKGSMPEECEISSFDLCVIFSNLLSNAMEAAEKCVEKNIDLELRQQEDTFIIYIKNTFDGKVVKKNGSIKTRKQDKQMHGYGLANIKECVKKNKGSVTIQEEDKYFVVKIYFT